MGGAEAKKHKHETQEAGDANHGKKPEAQAPANAEAKANSKADKKVKDGEVKERQVFVRERGTKWSLERCQKYARRFKTEAEWMAGSPASYKAAAHWGWLPQCSQHMGKSPRLVHSDLNVTAASNYASNPVNLVVVPGAKKFQAETNTNEEKNSNVHSLEKKKSKGAATKASKSKDSKKKAS